MCTVIRARAGVQLILVFLLTFALVAVVLEPDFHLSRCQVYHAGQVLSLRCRQILLLLEPPLQFVHLRLGKEDPALPALRERELHTLVLVEAGEAHVAHRVESGRHWRHGTRTLAIHQAGN